MAIERMPASTSHSVSGWWEAANTKGVSASEMYPFLFLNEIVPPSSYFDYKSSYKIKQNAFVTEGTARLKAKVGRTGRSSLYGAVM